jgi:hypothetical protein
MWLVEVYKSLIGQKWKHILKEIGLTAKGLINSMLLINERILKL